MLNKYFQIYKIMHDIFGICYERGIKMEKSIVNGYTLDYQKWINGSTLQIKCGVLGVSTLSTQDVIIFKDDESVIKEQTAFSHSHDIHNANSVTIYFKDDKNLITIPMDLELDLSSDYESTDSGAKLFQMQLLYPDSIVIPYALLCHFRRECHHKVKYIVFSLLKITCDLDDFITGMQQIKEDLLIETL